MTERRFKDLSELPRRLTGTLDVRALGDDLASRAMEATGAAIGAIALWDRANDRLVTLADLDGVGAGLAVPPGETYARLDAYPAARRVLSDRQAVTILLDRPDDDPVERGWLRKYGLRAAVLLPLLSRGDAIGLMYLARRQGPFEDEDLLYCQLFCDIAGSAIENATLYGELQSTLTQYRSLIERLPAVTYLDDLETGETRYISPQITELFGMTPEEWKATPGAWLRAVHPDDRERVGAAFDEAMETESAFHAEYRVVPPGGDPRWVVDRAVVLPRVDGQRSLAQGIIFDITDQKRAEQDLSHRAYHDPLTGLPNRDQFRAALDEAIARARRRGNAVAVMYVDLDDFKLVNDGFGHEVGDEVLVAVAERLRAATRSSDVVGRDGGDEFLVLMPDLPASLEGATRATELAATRVREALLEPVASASVELDISASVGVSLFPFDAADTQTLLKHADAAMYDAKASGRDACRFYEPGARDSAERLELAARLRQAIKHGGLSLRYQPVVELDTGLIVACEALARWDDPEHGPVAPDEFIPLAERTGLIRPLSEWAIREASRQAASWRAAGYDSHVSVNVPPDTCRQLGAPAIAAMIEAEGCNPAHITLEMTESATMVPRPGLKEELSALAAHGIQLAIDDFGTGYSSLARLGDFPVGVLKIDRSFVRGLPDARTGRTLVNAIMYLARGFGLTVVAEGVETEAQREFLLGSGCRYAQGYLFSPPVPAAELDVLLSTRGARTCREDGGRSSRPAAAPAGHSAARSEY
jgi:diguanylate cyclase (GGDEF)-like protein/PAS domain S-box-containing protein